jgi:hypothetical protein
MSTSTYDLPMADPEEHVFPQLTPATDRFAQRTYNAYNQATSEAADAMEGVTLNGPNIQPEPALHVVVPDNFHALTHHISLYILALRDGNQTLADLVFAQIREYYETKSFTPSAFRLEYTYTNTDGPCQLREYLVNRAAERVLAQATLTPQQVQQWLAEAQSFVPGPQAWRDAMARWEARNGIASDADNAQNACTAAATSAGLAGSGPAEGQAMTQSMEGVVRQGGELGQDFAGAFAHMVAERGPWY